MGTDENTTEGVVMTRDELLRHLIDFDVPLDDPIVTVPQAIVAQEAEDILAGKSEYISFDVIKLIQDTIIKLALDSQNAGSEQNTKRIAILADLQECIYQGQFQERPALKKQQKYTNAPEMHI